MKRLEKGSKLNNRYEIYRVLGQGGFGTTYVALDETLKQEVVIKEYFPKDEKNMERFLKEAQLQASIFEVPGVAKVLDFFKENGAGYIVMEYVKGTSLLDWMQRRDETYTFDQAWKLIRPVAETLVKVHNKGLLHRDISPDNLMVTEDGILKLLDFGAAREFIDDGEYEKTMTVLVKEGYTPPEQYERKAEHGPWSDVYALSAVLYEMITGTMPPNSLERQVADSLYAPSAYGAEITKEDEEKLLTKGLAVDGSERWQSMDAMIAGFDGSEESVTAGGDKKSGKRKVLIGVAVILAVAAVALIFNAFFGTGNSGDIPEVAGSYDRGSEEYNEFLKFVKENAVSEKADPDDPAAVIYTLDRKAVEKLGLPCNLYLHELTHDEIMKTLKEKGHDLKKVSKEEWATVTVGDYGMIKTDFIVKQRYMCDGNINIVVLYDMVTERVNLLTIYVKEGDDSALSTVAADLYLMIDKEADISRKEAIEGCEKWIAYCKPLKGGGFSGVEMDDEFTFGCIQSDNLESVDKIAFRLDATWAPTYYWP